MCCTSRRRRLSSTLLTMCWRDAPASLGPSPIGKRHLVARNRSSRWFFVAWPTISSDTPAEYMSAVSTRLTPWSTHRSIWRVAPSTSVAPSLENPPLPPKVIVPMVIVETFSPDRPSVRYSMATGSPRPLPTGT